MGGGPHSSQTNRATHTHLYTQLVPIHLEEHILKLFLNSLDTVAFFLNTLDTVTSVLNTAALVINTLDTV